MVSLQALTDTSLEEVDCIHFENVQWITFTQAIEYYAARANKDEVLNEAIVYRVYAFVQMFCSYIFQKEPWFEMFLLTCVVSILYIIVFIVMMHLWKLF